jgi:ATP-dependent helicase HrpA
MNLLLARNRPAPAASELTAPVRENLRAFPAEGLPETTTLTLQGAPVLVYPALQDQGTGVAVVHPLSAAESAQLNRTGYARLALLTQADTARFLRKELEREKVLALHFASLGDAQLLRDEVLMASAWHCFFEGSDLPRIADVFDSIIRERSNRLLPAFRTIIDTLKRILAARFELAKRMDELTAPAFAPALKEAREHVERLVPAHVLSTASAALLAEMPRYLQAELYRLNNLQGRITRDAERVRELDAFGKRIARYTQHRLANAQTGADLAQQLEEVRVGVFAEPLAKKGLGSPTRLDRTLVMAEQSIGLR